MAHRISTSRRGPNLFAVTRTKHLWATFIFAPGSRTPRRLTARWYAPGRAKPVGAFPVAGSAPFSFWGNPNGLKKGRWRCVLSSRITTLDRVTIRVG